MDAAAQSAELNKPRADMDAHQAQLADARRGLAANQAQLDAHQAQLDANHAKLDRLMQDSDALLLRQLKSGFAELVHASLEGAYANLGEAYIAHRDKSMAPAHRQAVAALLDPLRDDPADPQGLY
jgi:peptidoglycan hydrolase CwlO-like protein